MSDDGTYELSEESVRDEFEEVQIELNGIEGSIGGFILANGILFERSTCKLCIFDFGEVSQNFSEFLLVRKTNYEILRGG